MFAFAEGQVPDDSDSELFRIYFAKGGISSFYEFLFS